MLFFFNNRSYKGMYSHDKLKNVHIKLTGRNYGMVVVYKAQEKTAENFKNSVVPKIHLITEEKVWYGLTHSTGITVGSQVSAHSSSWDLGHDRQGKKQSPTRGQQATVELQNSSRYNRQDADSCEVIKNLLVISTWWQYNGREISKDR